MCINLAKWHSKQLLTWSSSCNLSRAIVVENKTSKKSADINPQNEKRRSPRRQYAILLSFDTSLGPVLFPQHFRTNLPISTRVCVPFSVPNTSPISTSCSIACNVHYPQIMFSTALLPPTYSRGTCGDALWNF